MKVQGNRYINNPEMIKNKVEKKTTVPQNIISEDDVKISDSARKLVETARDKVSDFQAMHFSSINGEIKEIPAEYKCENLFKLDLKATSISGEQSAFEGCSENQSEVFEKWLDENSSEYLTEVGIFLLGYSAHHNASALSFLKDTVSQHDSWKVQEVLAMAFDNHCKIIGYDVGLPLIKEWLNSDCANVRIAVSEGLRIWTSRPYFRDNPQIAIQLLSAHREDASEYVRKSVGNALRDISKKYPELISAELNLWDLSSKEIKQVYKLASKFLDSN